MNHKECIQAPDSAMQNLLW